MTGCLVTAYLHSDKPFSKKTWPGSATEIPNSLRYIFCKNFSGELSYYTLRGHLRLHTNLLTQMREQQKGFSDLRFP